MLGTDNILMVKFYIILCSLYLVVTHVNMLCGTVSTVKVVR